MLWFVFNRLVSAFFYNLCSTLKASNCENVLEYLRKQRLSIVVTIGVNKCLRRHIMTFITVIYSKECMKNENENKHHDGHKADSFAIHSLPPFFIHLLIHCLRTSAFSASITCLCQIHDLCFFLIASNHIVNDII